MNLPIKAEKVNAGNLEVSQSNNSSFTPYLKVTYGSSVSVTEGKAGVGQFDLSDDTFVKSPLTMIALDYRNIAQEKVGQVYGDRLLVSSKNKIDMQDYKPWTTFVDATRLPQGSKVISGLDLLVYIPVINDLRIFSMTNKLANRKAPSKIMLAGAQSELVEVDLELVRAENKKTGDTYIWYECNVSPYNGKDIEFNQSIDYAEAKLNFQKDCFDLQDTKKETSSKRER